MLIQPREKRETRIITQDLAKQIVAEVLRDDFKYYLSYMLYKTIANKNGTYTYHFKFIGADIQNNNCIKDISRIFEYAVRGDHDLQYDEKKGFMILSKASKDTRSELLWLFSSVVNISQIPIYLTAVERF